MGKRQTFWHFRIFTIQLFVHYFGCVLAARKVQLLKVRRLVIKIRSFVRVLIMFQLSNTLSDLNWAHQRTRHNDITHVKLQFAPSHFRWKDNDFWIKHVWILMPSVQVLWSYFLLIGLRSSTTLQGIIHPNVQLIQGMLLVKNKHNPYP